MSTYVRFLTEDIVEANQTVVTTGLWSGDEGRLETSSLFLSDTQAGNSGEYYLDAFNKNPNTDDLAEVQFAVTYGHINGGGAPTIQDDDQAKLPTKVIYSQYRNLLLQPSDPKFIFSGAESDHIYVINLQRARVKEQLDPGNWQLPLSGANGKFTFIDDSGQTLGAFTTNSQSGRVFKVVSGSITSATGSVVAATEAPNGKGFGYVYPDLGIIVLNPDAICPTVGFYTSASSLTVSASSATGSSLLNGEPIYTNQNVSTLDDSFALPYAPLTSSIAAAQWGTNRSAYNHAGLYVALRNAVLDENLDFRARSAETISSTHYFVRLRNSQFNYSNNPTFSNPTDGTLVQPDFKDDPKTYVTTIGLYNDSNELLAAAKLSKPVRKSFAEEILMRVRLDF
jgi:hypothetical protein